MGWREYGHFNANVYSLYSIYLLHLAPAQYETHNCCHTPVVTAHPIPIHAPHCAHYFFRAADQIICHARREHFRHWAHQPMQELGTTNSVPRYTELKAKLLLSTPHCDALCTKAAISQHLVFVLHSAVSVTDA